MNGLQITNLIISALGLAWTFILSAFVLPVRNKIQNLDGEVKRATEAAIANKLEAMKERHDAAQANTMSHVTEIRERLFRGESRFTKLDERDQRLQVEVMQRLDELKDFMHEKLATKEEVSRLIREHQQ